MDGQLLNADPGKHGASSIIEYTARTGRRLVLDDATKSEPFGTDPELKRRQVLSVLCLPLMLHDRPIGYVYLENNLTSHAFNAESLGFVEVLAAQASVSLSNARGYEALRESEERFRELAEKIPEVFWITSPDYREMIFVSPAFEQIWGRTCESLYDDPRSWSSAIHPEERDAVKQALLRDVETGLFDEEYRIIRPDKSIRWIRDRAFPIRDEDGTLLRISGLALDITEQKAIAHALKKSNDELDLRVQERTAELASTNQELTKEIKQREQAQIRETEFGRILDESLNEIYVFHAESLRFIHVNQGDRKNLDYSMEELRELTPLDLKPAVSSRKFSQLVSPLREGGGATISFETVHQRKNGTEYPVEVNLQMASFENSPCFVAVVLDITDRKLAEQEQLLSTEIMENLSEGVSLVRVSDSTLVYTNSGFDRLFGYEKGELIGKHTSVLYGGSERARQESAEAVAAAPVQIGSWYGELHMARKDGSVFWVQTTISTFQHPVFGNVRIGVGQDISERRETQQALVRSEERNLAAQRIARFGHWD
ncbi:MAG: PAS domain S-box protein [Fuerstiella sp.]